MVYFDVDEMTVKSSFLKLVFLEADNAIGILEGIDDAFKSIGIENFYEKLVGFGVDGASVNHGDKEGVKTLSRGKCPCLKFGWCISHRLELVWKDALKGTSFDVVDEFILCMHLLYRKSPKKLRQLKELVDAYDVSEEFDVQTFRPKKAPGTRWISHKIVACDTPSSTRSFSFVHYTWRNGKY